MAGIAPVTVDPTPDAGPPTGLGSLLGLAFDRSSLAMVLVDEFTRVVCANDAAECLLAAQPLVGRSMTEFSAVGSGRALSFLAVRGEHDQLEQEIELIAGSGRAVRLAVQVDAVVLPSAERYFLVQLSDITQDRRRERELELSEHRHRQVVDNLPDTSVIMFDPELRITLAAGEALAANGYTADMTGLTLSDAVPRKVVDILEGPYRSALAGRDVDFEYSSPVLGRQFRVRTRPLTDTDGEIVGGLSVMEDITADRARRSLLQQANKLGRLGSCRFDRVAGWTFDDELVTLWGRCPTPQENGLPIETIPDADRSTSVVAWERAISDGGRHRFTYRILRGGSEYRSLQCAVEADVDSAGSLTRAISTHVDITEAVAAREAADTARAQAANERIALLRSVGEALSVGHAGTEELLTGVVKLASRTLGDGAGIAILAPDLQSIERDLVEHPDPAIRRRFGETLRASAQPYNPDSPLAAEIVGRGNVVSRFRAASWQEEFAGHFRDRVVADAQDFMIAPVRHAGKVLGLMTVFRTRQDQPYSAGDDDVLQVFADAAGTALAESRLQDSLEQGRDLVRELSNHRKDLLDQLAVLETRERSLLAEAIHDEPIQVIVSAIMRIDYLIRRMEGERAQELERVASALEGSVEWLRNLVVVALSPPDLAGGLAISLRVLADGIFAGTPTVFEVAGATDSYQQIPSMEAVYRIFREALVNVRNHAQASSVVLRLAKSKEAVVLSLSDDGVGSALLDAGPGHLGLATMRARARAEGGALTIESSPGHGTTVSLTLPTREGERP
jgi:signal transduction histidine kinase/PAS domain-containing protein